MDKVTQIKQFVDAKKDIFTGVSEEVWSYAELGFKEHKSAEALMKVLREQGFEVKTGLGGVPTAFVASYGKTGPTIGLLGEFDALPLLSQKAGKTTHDPIVEGGCGHGCGHNALGAASLAAAVAVKDYLQANNLPGTVEYYGCPGEEFGAGKMFMARSGCFDHLDAAFTWHPANCNSVVGVSSLANISVNYIFHGKTAHAAAAPHLGRSALDACELTNVAANYLREHIPTDCRLHYAYQDVGGPAPNVVQDHATVLYFVRAPKLKTVLEVLERMNNCAKGAALMTGTQVEIQIVEGLCDFIPNSIMTKQLYDSFVESGAPVFSEEDKARAAELVFSEDEVNSAADRIEATNDKESAEKCRKQVLVEDILPFCIKNYCSPGSTDVGDVSYCTPTAQLHATCWAFPTPGHSWQVTSQVGCSIGHTGMLAAAKAMALATVESMEKPEMLAAAKEELIKATGGKYTCPVPDDVMPDLVV